MYLKSKLNDRNLCKISTEDIVLSKVGKRCVFFSSSYSFKHGAGVKIVRYRDRDLSFSTSHFPNFVVEDSSISKLADNLLHN